MMIFGVPRWHTKITEIMILHWFYKQFLIFSGAKAATELLQMLVFLRFYKDIW